MAKAPNAIVFDWEGADEMDEARGDGWAELQDDGSLVGEMTFHNSLGDFNSLLL